MSASGRCDEGMRIALAVMAAHLRDEDDATIRLLLEGCECLDEVIMTLAGLAVEATRMKAGPSVPDEILAGLCAKHAVRIAAGREVEGRGDENPDGDERDPDR